ncbi:MAG: FMN-binding protein [Planctomycetes bacterium]|nr:FMN-binding protein [Planctomycetota bacterium]
MKLDVNRPTYVVCYTLVVSSVFTAAITSLQVATRGRVKRNEALLEERAIVSVFGLGDAAAMSQSAIAEAVRRRVDRSLTVRDPETGREFRVLRCSRSEASPEAKRDESDLAAVAFEFRGVGFWAPIKGWMALTPDLGKAVGLIITEQSETPGLGGRVTEEWWQAQFKGLDVSPPAEGRKFLYVGGGAPTSPKDPRSGRYVDAITGATQTSLAVGKFLGENLRQFRRAMASARRSGR